jgi:hypothetical protein
VANSTEEYWSFNGTSLSQYGWAVATVGGSRYDVPTRRGDNIRLAYRPGEVHRNKLVEPRVISLIMWMTGTTPGTGAGVADPMVQWNDNWDTLRRLFFSPGGSQLTLTRRWKLTISGTPTVLAADAQAELVDVFNPKMTGRFRSEFNVELLLADPYFYGAQVTENFAVGTPVTVANPGHDVAAHNNFEVDLIGPLTNPRLTNSTPNPDVWVQYTGTVSSGQTLRLSIPNFTATRVSDSANLIAGISHSGTRYWMALTPGNNSLTLTASSGSGTAQLRYKPPYI